MNKHLTFESRKQNFLAACNKFFLWKGNLLYNLPLSVFNLIALIFAQPIGNLDL